MAANTAAGHSAARASAAIIGRRHDVHATVVVGCDDILSTAHNRLRNGGYSQLPVMADDRLIGVLTEEDIIRFVFGHPGRMTSLVGEAMQTSIPQVDKDIPISRVIEKLKAEPFIAVMDQDRFLGLITRTDVLNYLRKQTPRS